MTMKRHIIIALWVFLMVLLMIYPFAHAQDHHHPTETITGATARLYDTWRIKPDRTTSCCSRKDCYSVEAKMIGGNWFFKHRESGKWLMVPDSRVEDESGPDNPDGQNHVCASPSGQVFCFMAGGGT
jgi:hypothetical protein